MNASSSEPAHILYDNPSTKRRFHESWKENLDDSSLTGNNGVDPDITRMMVVEEERMVENTVQYEEAEFSAREEFEETAKLLLAGGVAGAVSKTATAPLARLTILYQVRACVLDACMILCVSRILGTINVFDAIHIHLIRPTTMCNRFEVYHPCLNPHCPLQLD